MSVVHVACWMNFRNKGWKLGSIDSVLNRIRKSVNQVATDRVRRVATRTLRRWKTSCSVRKAS